MWIVRVALNRPYTFVVLALLILLVSPLVILRTPTDIFPNIAIPVVSVIWNYDGFPPQEMSDRIVTITERSITTTISSTWNPSPTMASASSSCFSAVCDHCDRARASHRYLSDTASPASAGNHRAANSEL